LKPQQLGVIIPVYKGEKFLAQLIAELLDFKSYLEQGEYELILTEVVFVDDCSVDNSFKLLKSYESRYSWIKVIKMSTNSGQHAAIVEGMRNSHSEWLITMDEDLQHKPKDIISLWEQRNRKEADLVYAVPLGSVHRSFVRNLSSKWIKKLMARLSSKKEVLYFNSFRLIKRALVLKAVDEFKKNDYLDMVMIEHTDKISTVSLNLIDIRSLEKGESSYNTFKLFKHAKKLVNNLSFSR
jgi:glycosyltransferase involved in cell wall biosynthesis